MGINDYNYTLNFFDSVDNDRNGIRDIPNQMKYSLNPFQYGPDLLSYNKWIDSGYLNMMAIINNLILQLTTADTHQINVAVAAQKFYTYKNDPFSRAIGFILPFFLVIAYVCPLCIIVFRFVSDKVK